MIFLDIETRRPQSDTIRGYLQDRDVKPRANLKDPAKIQADIAAKRKAALQDTPLQPMWGEVAVVCMDGDTTFTVDARFGDEREMLVSANGILERAREYLKGRQPVFCGFNVGFDLRFLWTRMRIHGIKPSVNLRHDAKPWDEHIVDLRHLLTGGDRYAPGSLTDWVVAFGGEPRTDDIPGAEIPDAIEDGRWNEVVRHCVQDVRDCMWLWERVK